MSSYRTGVPAPSGPATVDVAGLGMTYRVPVRTAGLRAAFRSLVHREYKHLAAVSDVSFQIPAGQVVGFIGPNGAGKTTTMKILSGILHPTAGRARVLGFDPHRRHRDFLKQIALVRGSSPISGPTELTVMDNFAYRRLLYEINEDRFRANVAELTGILDLGPLLGRQLRALSLGERMRAGLALALVHRPRVLYLDEPTIGLDATAAIAVRRHVADYARTTDATVMLTSHYMTEVEALCSRVLLIDRGRLRYDGSLPALAARLSPSKLIRVQQGDEAAVVEWERYGEVADAGPDHVTLRVPRTDVPRVTAALLAEVRVSDLTVTDPPLESVIDRFYRVASA
ncbi:MAG: ABC transporter ATP-binding protein [Mycobacteriales bacterium]